MKITEQKAYQFEFAVDGIDFGFVVAEQDEANAKERLREALQAILEELNASIYHTSEEV